MLSLRSQLRRKLLTYFYQLASILGADSTNLSRELARLERDGFLPLGKTLPSMLKLPTGGLSQ